MLNFQQPGEFRVCAKICNVSCLANTKSIPSERNTSQVENKGKKKVQEKTFSFE